MPEGMPLYSLVLENRQWNTKTSFTYIVIVISFVTKFRFWIKELHAKNQAPS